MFARPHTVAAAGVCRTPPLNTLGCEYVCAFTEAHGHARVQDAAAANAQLQELRAMYWTHMRWRHMAWIKREGEDHIWDDVKRNTCISKGILAHGSAVIAALEANLVHVACDDVGGVLARGIYLPLVRSKIDALAVRHAAAVREHHAQELIAEVVRLRNLLCRQVALQLGVHAALYTLRRDLRFHLAHA